MSEETHIGFFCIKGVKRLLSINFIELVYFLRKKYNIELNIICMNRGMTHRGIKTYH